MTPVPNFSASSRLEKVASDNGFDRVMGTDGDWLIFASSQTSLRLWLAAPAEGVFLAAFSMPQVAAALHDMGDDASPPPAGAVGARAVAGFPELHHLVRRAFQLSRTLPDALLDQFTRETAHLPRATEVERLTIQRVGQDIFRRGLFEYWEGRCAVTGLAVPELLRASHIKPWAACDTDAERLDVFNGLLLAPHLDAVFDSGLVSFNDQGSILISDALKDESRSALGLSMGMSVTLAADHRSYLRFHRERVFDSRRSNDQQK